jgi:MEKHLA domain
MPDAINPDWINHTQILLDSFRHWLDRDLIARSGTPDEQAQSLFNAPFVVVSHGTEADPILNYGNNRALALWEMDVATFLRTPSRQTAEPVHRDERARLLERTTRDGYVDDYRGIRISRTGRRFEIEQAIVWNLLDGAGRHVGQAATFAEWRYLDDNRSGVPAGAGR